METLVIRLLTIWPIREHLTTQAMVITAVVDTAEGETMDMGMEVTDTK